MQKVKTAVTKIWALSFLTMDNLLNPEPVFCFVLFVCMCVCMSINLLYMIFVRDLNENNDLKF